MTTNKRRRVGVVLAAGESSRNPNKLLLPTAHGIASAWGLPMFLQAAEWCYWSQQCDSVVVVLREGSAVDLWLQAYGCRPQWLHRVYQTRVNGVVGAICAGVSNIGKCDETLIVFGDNAYDPRERVSDLTDANDAVGDAASYAVASVRVLGGERARGLDYFERGRWHASTENWALPPQQCFAGWLLLSADRSGWLQVQFEGRAEDVLNMPSLLTGCYVRPVLVSETYMWHDVGTVEGYARYLRECGGGA